MRKILVYAAILPLVLTGCEPGSSPKADAPEATADVAATDSGDGKPGSEGVAKIVQLTQANPLPDKPSDPVSAIKNVKFITGIGGHFITADLTYGGGCKEHEFQAVWDGSWMESMPPQMTIRLLHDAKGDRCKAIVNDTVQINIGDLVKAEPNFLAMIQHGPITTDPVEVSLK